MIAKFLLFSSIFASSLAAVAATQDIQVYSWTDSAGVSHYSQFPPKGNTSNYEVTQIKQPISIPSTKTKQKIKEQMGDIEKYIIAQKNLRKNKTRRLEVRKQREGNCENARKNLILYQNNYRIRARTDDGYEIQVLSEEERLSRVKRAELDIDSNCLK